MQLYNLPWKIPCEVMNVELKAEPDTDEPDENGSSEEEMPAAPPAAPVRPRVHSFCKTLTASDTSTHGVFSVLRRHTDECLPPLDMSRQPPTQELVAKDLHGAEWRFRHIFRVPRMWDQAGNSSLRAFVDTTIEYQSGLFRMSRMNEFSVPMYLILDTSGQKIYMHKFEQHMDGCKQEIYVCHCLVVNSTCYLHTQNKDK